MSQKIFSGYQSRKNLIGVLHEYSPRMIMLVTGNQSYALSGAEEFIKSVFSDFSSRRFSELHVNPRLDDIEKGLEIFRSENCDLVVGIGGGSVMDTAKAISILAEQEGSVEDFVRGNVPLGRRTIPSVMIPTTAGSGSESTHFSVIYVGKDKCSMADSSMLPDIAILDPKFTENLSPYITACSGIDALCHGIESFWSVNSTEESIGYSKEAIRLVVSNIVQGVNSPDKETREKLLMASNMAGRAINIAKTSAAHALSYSLTTFFNIPHGHAVALTLPLFIEFNSEVDPLNVQDERGSEFVRSLLNDLYEMLGTDSPSGARDVMCNIMKEIKLETNFSELGISMDETEVIIKNVNLERLRNNPRQVSENDIRTLLGKIL